MRLRIALATLVAVVGLGGSLASGTSALAAPTVASCGNGYVSAHLSWGNKCLRAGQFCKVGNKEYRRYGFVCPANGHLRRA
jgi:hypothetical protein